MQGDILFVSACSLLRWRSSGFGMFRWVVEVWMFRWWMAFCMYVNEEGTRFDSIRVD